MRSSDEAVRAGHIFFWCGDAVIFTRRSLRTQLYDEEFISASEFPCPVLMQSSLTSGKVLIGREPSLVYAVDSYGNHL